MVGMRITNRSKRSVVSESAQIRRSLWGKARGLMFSRHLDLVFEFPSERNVPLHMLFVFHPIDVVFLDDNKKVVELRKDLQPWSFYSPKNRSRWVIELKAGAVRSSKTTIGDTLVFD
jgi:uncharacterized protein